MPIRLRGTTCLYIVIDVAKLIGARLTDTLVISLGRDYEVHGRENENH